MEIDAETYAYIRACVSSMARGLPPDDVLDIVQDAAVRAARSGGPSDPRMWRPYARSICRHAVAGWFRALARSPASDELDPEAHAGPRMGDALDRLAGLHPDAPGIAMMMADGASRHAVARRYGLRLGQLRRLLDRMREALEDWLESGPG